MSYSSCKVSAKQSCFFCDLSGPQYKLKKKLHSTFHVTSPQKNPHLFDKIKRSSSIAWKILIFYCIVGFFSCAKANVALFYMSRELRKVAFVAAITPSRLFCSGGSRLCSTVLCQSLLFG